MSNKSKATEMKEDGQAVLVPKLRFPEFRDAVGWVTKPMDKVYAFKGNNSLSREKLNYERGALKKALCRFVWNLRWSLNCD